jgi:hypothetical protein
MTQMTKSVPVSKVIRPTKLRLNQTKPLKDNESTRVFSITKGSNEHER